jgi:hypothetical protein
LSRSEIVLATADGQGTVEIVRRTGMSKLTAWPWLALHLEDGVRGPKQNGTTTLVAALDVKSGLEIGDWMPRQRTRGWPAAGSASGNRRSVQRAEGLATGANLR